MADHYYAAAPNIGNDNENHNSEANLIELRPVVPYTLVIPSCKDVNSSSLISPGPKRARVKSPSRSQSPSGKSAELRELNVIVKEEAVKGGETEEVVIVEEEFGSENAIEEVIYVEESDETIQARNGSNTRSKGQLWKLVCSLPSEEIFHKWKKDADQKIAPARWGKRRETETKQGIKHYYKCNMLGCSAELSVMYPSSSQEVEVSANEKDHVHALTCRKWGLSDETKQEIKRLWDSGLSKPKLIKDALDKRGLGDIKYNQLTNFLNRMRSQGTSTTPNMSMSELNEWCTKHTISQPSAALDEDIDRVYVFDHIVNAETRQFRFILSSKRLMKFAAQASTINLDASISMKWFDALVLFVGVTDAMGQTFPVCFVVMSHETKANYSVLLKMLKRCAEAGSKTAFSPGCVIGHADPTLTEAVQDVFPCAARRLCWLRVKKETNTLFKYMDKETRDACEKDVSSLRLSCSKAQFELAAKLMLEKWRELLPSSDVPSKFEEQFVKLHPGWYEGFDVASYSSNKSLMLAVNAVKNRHTLRERLPVEPYLTLAHDLVLEWSVDTRLLRALQDSVTPDSALLSDTCRLQREQKTMVEVHPYIYVPTGDRIAATVEEVDVFESKMRGAVQSFDEFMEARMSLWKVEDTGNKSDLADMLCTCPRYFSGKLCEHVLAIGSAFGLFTLPPSAWDSGSASHGASGLQRKRGSKTPLEDSGSASHGASGLQRKRGSKIPRGKKKSKKKSYDTTLVTVDYTDMEHYT